MVVVVDAVAYGVEAVVVADVEAVAEVDYICHAFTGDAVDCRAGETEGQMLLNQFRYLYAG